MRLAALLGFLAAFTSGCSHTLSGIPTTVQRRIWVVVDAEKIFRCADANDVDQPPRPVCVRAPLTSSGE